MTPADLRIVRDVLRDSARLSNSDADAMTNEIARRIGWSEHARTAAHDSVDPQPTETLDERVKLAEVDLRASIDAQAAAGRPSAVAQRAKTDADYAASKERVRAGLFGTRPIGFYCARCGGVFDWTTEKPIPEGAAEIKTIGSRYCPAPACLDAEVKAHGISRERVMAMRKAMGRVVPKDPPLYRTLESYLAALETHGAREDDIPDLVAKLKQALALGKRVQVTNKHGIMETGRRGDCANDCTKCLADKLLEMT